MRVFYNNFVLFFEISIRKILINAYGIKYNNLNSKQKTSNEEKNNDVASTR